MFVHRGCFPQHQPLDDFRRNQAVDRLEHRGLGRERLEGGPLAGNAAQKAVDLPMAAQAVRQTVPAGSLPVRVKDGAEKRLHPPGTHERPRGSGVELAPVHFGEARFEIVVAGHRGEGGVPASHPGPALFQAPAQPAAVPFDRDARLPESRLDPPRRGAER